MEEELPNKGQEKKHYLTVDESNKGKRLDKFIAGELSEFSRTKIQDLILSGNIALKDQITIKECSYKVEEGDEFSITVPEFSLDIITPKHQPLNIIFEDKYIIIIDKPAGLTVHPGAGNYHDTLVNLLIALCGNNLSDIGGQERPGIVHRLDRDTSGLMVIAKTNEAHKSLADQLKMRELKRVYHALVWGIVSPIEGRIEANIGRSPKNRKKMAVVKEGGKIAITHYKIMEVLLDGALSLIECKLETGRTHQIRVHLTYKGHSIVGDKTYGNPRKKLPKNFPQEIQNLLHHFPRQALHAVELQLTHPKTKKAMQFMSKLPEDMEGLLSRLR